MNLNEKQKAMFAEKVIDLAHVAVGGLIFGQTLFNKSFLLRYAIVGILILLILYTMSYLLTRKR